MELYFPFLSCFAYFLGRMEVHLLHLLFFLFSKKKVKVDGKKITVIDLAQCGYRRTPLES